jgi:ABC-type glycerol-3-phosphate transport system substrate-binding protein
LRCVSGRPRREPAKTFSWSIRTGERIGSRRWPGHTRTVPESHPDIRVFYALDPPSETFDEKTLADFQAGTAADVFQGCCSSFPIWAQKGYALDLRPYVQADLDQATIQDWDPVQYKAFFARDGKQYGLPKYHGALALYYNKDLFDKYKVDYPNESWNHDDYRGHEATPHDRDSDGKPICGAACWTFRGIAFRFISTPKVVTWPIDDPTRSDGQAGALQALEWLRARMWDDKVMATPLDVQKMGTSEAFVAEKLAMVDDGSWALKSILSGANFRIGVAPFPAGPARRATLATTDGFGIYAGTKHPKAAWELVQFLISQEYGRAMAKAQFLQPARASLVEDWIGYVRAEFPEKAKDMDIAAFADGHLKGYSVVAETFANMAEARRMAYAAWEQILTLGTAPVDLIESTSRQIEGAQQGFK